MNATPAAKTTKTTAHTSDFFKACKKLYNKPIYALVLKTANSTAGTVADKEAMAKSVLRGMGQTDDPIALLKSIGKWAA